MLGNQISPIEQTLVIIQVARQLLPRVTPEKTYIEVSHCFFGIGSRHTLVYTQTFMDSTTTYSCDTLVAGLVVQSMHVDWWCLYWIHGYTDLSAFIREHAKLPHMTELTEVSQSVIRWLRA